VSLDKMLTALLYFNISVSRVLECSDSLCPRFLCYWISTYFMGFWKLSPDLTKAVESTI